MMNGHPDGEKHSERMLTLAAMQPVSLPAGARVLDLGAGDGSFLKLLRDRGYEAEGIDLVPRGSGVTEGDLLHTPYEDGSFDAVFSQCAFHVSGDVTGAFRESHRILKDGGVLILSDIDRMAELRDEARHAQFAVLYEEDLTEVWKKYYIECIWNGTADEACCPGYSEIKENYQNKFGYTLIICKK